MIVLSSDSSVVWRGLSDVNRSNSADEARDGCQIAFYGFKEDLIARYQKTTLSGLGFQHGGKKLADGFLNLERVLDPGDLSAILRSEPETCSKRQQKCYTSRLGDVFANELPRAGTHSAGHLEWLSFQEAHRQPI